MLNGGPLNLKIVYFSLSLHNDLQGSPNAIQICTYCALGQYLSYIKLVMTLVIFLQSQGAFISENLHF